MRGADVAALAGAYAVGSVPCSWLVARALRGVDLRDVDTGTVSGTGVYRVAGLGPLVLAGLLDVGKGALAVALARRIAGAQTAGHLLAPGAAVAGHNWSMALGGAGGRGIGPAIGALTDGAPEGSALLVAGICAGKAAGESAIGALASYLALPVVLHRRRGRVGLLRGGAVLVPMFAKRLAGNARPGGGSQVYLWRFLYDRDSREAIPA